MAAGAPRSGDLARRPCIDSSSALAIDLFAAARGAAGWQRMPAALSFEQRLATGRKAAASRPLLVFNADETKERRSRSSSRSRRRWPMRLPGLIAARSRRPSRGKRPDAVFVARAGKPRKQAAIALAIQNTVLRELG